MRLLAMRLLAWVLTMALRGSVACACRQWLLYARDAAASACAYLHAQPPNNGLPFARMRRKMRC